jgi:predicted ABC-type ATPase
LLRRATDAGFDVTLIYIGIASPELSSRRVDQRLEHGGHDVPRDRLASRYKRSLDNLRQALGFVPTVELFDNSDAAEPYVHIATVRNGQVVFRKRGRFPRWCRGLLPRR